MLLAAYDFKINKRSGMEMRKKKVFFFIVDTTSQHIKSQVRRRDKMLSDEDYDRLRLRVARMKRTALALTYIYFPLVILGNAICGWLLFSWKLNEFRTRHSSSTCRPDDRNFASVTVCGLVDESADAGPGPINPGLGWYIANTTFIIAISVMSIVISVLFVGTARGDVARAERRLMAETSLRTLRLATRYLLYLLRHERVSEGCALGACA
jgi:hypothetical protein